MCVMGLHRADGFVVALQNMIFSHQILNPALGLV